MNDKQKAKMAIEDLKKVDITIQAKQDPKFAESVHPYLIENVIELLKKSAITESIHQAEQEVIKRVVGLYGIPICDHLHHKKTQRHTSDEICLVVLEINSLINKLWKTKI